MKKLLVIFLIYGLWIPAVFGLEQRNAVMQRAAVTETVPHVVPSGNWSGYALTGKFTEIHGTFTVPSVGNTGGSLAEWVGIDGYNNTDLIQAGVSENAVTDYVWWEILPSPSIPIFWMKVSAGDEITVGVRKYEDKWVVDILDHSTLQFFYQQFPYNGPAESAEWVVEAPTSLFAGQLPVLPYDGVQFSGLSYTGNAKDYHDLWMIQKGAVQSLPSTLGSTKQLIANGFSTEYAG